MTDAHLFFQRLIAAASGPVIEGPRTLDVLRAIAARHGLTKSRALADCPHFRAWVDQSTAKLSGNRPA
jgi:serine/threonine protein kinase HipA of HipAB toxin-antitoxin module